jgi:hypothetical protein
MKTRLMSPVKEYIDKTLKEQERKDKVTQDFNDNYHIMNEKARLSIRNWLFYVNNQYSPREEYNIKKRGQQPYVFNETQRLIKNLCGAHSQNTLDTICVGRNHNDGLSTSLMNYILKWIEQINNMKRVENDVFRDGIIKGAGWVELSWDKFNGRWGYPNISKIAKEEIFHSEFKEPDASDCSFIARLQYVKRNKLLTLFPDQKDQIKKADYGDLKLQNYINRYHLYDYWDYDPKSFRTDRDLLPLIKHYEKTAIYQYLVSNDIKGDSRVFDTEKEAWEFHNGLQDGYISEGKNIYDDDGENLLAVNECIETNIIQTIMVGNELLSADIMALNEYPYIPYFPEICDGSYTAPMNVLKDYNRLINSSYSNLDLIMGSTNKNAWKVNRHLLDMSVSDLEREAANPNAFFFVKGDAGIVNMPNNPVSPEYFRAMEFGLQRMPEVWGGKELMGIQESAAASGRAAQSRIAQGGLQRVPLFDQLSEFRKSLAYRLVWWIKNYMEKAQILEVIGSSDDVQFVDLKDDALQTIKELEYDIQTQESTHSETMQIQRLDFLREILQNFPELRQALLPMVVEDSPFTQKQKDTILDNNEIYKAQHQKEMEMQHQQKLQQEVQDSVSKIKLKAMEMQAEEISQQEQELANKQKALNQQLQGLLETNAKTELAMNQYTQHTDQLPQSE